ncbi:MAG: MarR family transcriptional regulator [Nocardioides sp.]|nr:MarR family transcriptional regulator [Nocardioides sp.]
MGDTPPGEWPASRSLVALRAALDEGARVRRALSRRAGLSDTELLAVQHLMGETLGPGDVARRLGVTPSAATGVVDRLVGHGHVERGADPDDRRRSVLRMTDPGRAEVMGHLMPMLRALHAVDSDLDEHERAVVAAYLERVAASLGAVADDDGEPAPPHAGTVPASDLDSAPHREDS